MKAIPVPPSKPLTRKAHKAREASLPLVHEEAVGLPLRPQVASPYESSLPVFVASRPLRRRLVEGFTLFLALSLLLVAVSFFLVLVGVF